MLVCCFFGGWGGRRGFWCEFGLEREGDGEGGMVCLYQRSSGFFDGRERNEPFRRGLCSLTKFHRPGKKDRGKF